MLFLDDLDRSSDQKSEPFVEGDPSGRYGRYKEMLGVGAVKKVYRAFDILDGKEVAWNQVSLTRFANDEPMLQRIFTEAWLLRSLQNHNIITSFDAWRDNKAQTLNFITPVFMSGNLRQYRRKHPRVSLKAIKKWLRQILGGLDYLHSHNPCIIHRDLNCSNLFINGNDGERCQAAHSCLGTPEYMAPELYEEKYTETVDIYSFGMCVLELVTMEIPYSECDNLAKIYKKVSCGVKPRALAQIKDLEVKEFIEKCIGHDPNRPSAAQLLEDSFFEGLDDDQGLVLV
ncbi:hypothetical protein UlMin_017574 [Ulmus minor]